MTNTNQESHMVNDIDDDLAKYLDNRLTHQQQRFCDSYLTHFNAFKAAVEAGYSENTSRKGALLHVPKIQRYLSEVMNGRSRRLEITHDMLLREYSKIAFANMGNYYDENATLKDMTALTVDEKAAIRDYSLQDFANADGSYAGSRARIKLHNKMAALDRIAKHLGFFGMKPRALGSPQSESPEVRKKEVLTLEHAPHARTSDEILSEKQEVGSMKQEESTPMVETTLIAVVDRGRNDLPMDYPVEDFELEGIELKTLMALEGVDFSLESGVWSHESEEEGVAAAVAGEQMVEKFLTISPLGESLIEGLNA